MQVIDSVYHQNHDAFKALVNAKIKDGWKLHGIPILKKEKTTNGRIVEVFVQFVYKDQ